jgi:hypothetical protein
MLVGRVWISEVLVVYLKVFFLVTFSQKYKRLKLGGGQAYDRSSE